MLDHGYLEAKAALQVDCCFQGCLVKQMGGVHEATLVIAYCRAKARKHHDDVVTWMSFVQDCVKPCVDGISSQGSFKDLKYKIYYGHQEIAGICRSAFLSCYGI